MGSFRVCGPHFFKDEGATVTVTSDRYCEMLKRFLHPKVTQLLADLEPDDHSMVWNGREISVWNMEDARMENFKNGIEDNLPYFHTNSILDFVHFI